MNQITIDGWKRVSKKTARKLYNEGRTIRLCPVKFHPCNKYYPMSFDMSINDEWSVEPFEWEKTFDARTNNFEFYNCNLNETGKYSAFYVREEGVEFTIIGDTKDYGACLIYTCGKSFENAKKVLYRMEHNPDAEDVRVMQTHSNIRINEIESRKCWWNDPFLAN